MGSRLRHLAVFGPFNWWQWCGPIDGVLFIQRHPLEAGRQESASESRQIGFRQLRKHEDVKVRHQTAEHAVNRRRRGHATVLPLLLRLHELLRGLLIPFLGGRPNKSGNVVAEVVA